MPLLKPKKGETENQFIKRFMSNEAMKKEFPEQKQRIAIAFSTWKQSRGGGK